MTRRQIQLVEGEIARHRAMGKLNASLRDEHMEVADALSAAINQSKGEKNMRTYAILNMKGGVGKTTTAINLAYLLAAEHNLRVLLIDADGQQNATRFLLPPHDYDGLGALLKGGADQYADLDELVVATDIENLDMLPASPDLWGVDLQCMTMENSGVLRRLAAAKMEWMEEESYDVIIIDCPPSFSAPCVAAIAASDGIVIPVLPDAFSAEGMSDLVEQIDGCRKVQPYIHVSGILINQWHRADVVLDAVDYIRETAPVPVYDTVIRRTDKVIESTWCKQPVLMWSPQSSAARDYRAFAAEFVNKEGLFHGRKV